MEKIHSFCVELSRFEESLGVGATGEMINDVGMPRNGK